MSLVPVVVRDRRRVGILAAQLLANRLAARPSMRMLLPTGRTPVEMYAALRRFALAGVVDLSAATVFQLDEYVGLAPVDPRSFQFRLRHELRGVALGALHALDGTAGDPVHESARHEHLLEAAPIDLAILGLGRDGHVAFDEPGSDPRGRARVVALDAVTRQDAAEQFGGLEGVPHAAVTVGLATLLGARELLLLVTGASKARTLRATLEGEVGPEVPASLLREHPALTLVCDREAAAELALTRRPGSDRVVVVLGHREPGISREHRISAESFARIHRAERLVKSTGARLAILTGYTSTGGRSEAEQMAAAWAAPETATLLEVAGRDTAENASRSLPLILAAGDVSHVDVVSSIWHVRVPYMFAPYRAFGLDVRFVPAFGPGSWPRMLRTEVTELRRARAQRADAFARVRPLLDPELGT